MSNNAHELSNRLLNALDNNYNVVDMHIVNEIISILERINITKELLETTRLGKHVNELRRKTTDPTLARRAKVLVKRWRDLVIPTVASPGHTGSNRSSAERQVRRLGGTPLTSPALSRQVVSPAVPSPRPPSRPAWGGYESDSQDVILVDDEPPAPPAPNPLTLAHKPLTPPVKRPLSPAEPLYDEKKAKRDKKPKKRRSHSRAGTGTEATAPPVPAPVPSPLAARPAPAATGAGAGLAPWGGRNGTSHERRRNGTRQPIDSYQALVNRMPPAGAKKVKTTKELLEQIQSRGSKPAASPSSPRSPRSPRSPASPDVMLIEPDAPVVKVESPLRNGGKSPRAESPVNTYEPLEDEREYYECTCGDVPEESADPACPAAQSRAVRPATVQALHHAYLPGVNGTRAPVHPHRFAVRPPEDPERPGLFASVVPLYKYSDYADDYCVKNMSRVPLCAHLPWTEFAPAPPDLPPPPSPPPVRPYPIDDPPPKEEAADDEEEDDEEDKPTIKLEPAIKQEPPIKDEPETDEPAPLAYPVPEKVEAEMVGVPTLEPSERLKAPLLTAEDESAWSPARRRGPAGAVLTHDVSPPPHRTVERTKPETGGGAALLAAVASAIDAVPYDYEQLAPAPVLPREALDADAAVAAALAAPAAEPRDELARPPRPARFAEWHECAALGALVALPYVVID